MNKMIVLDLDGTLLKDDKTVSKETINILLKFKSAGNEILFATARPPRDAYKYVPEELRDNPIICYNGACIINGKEIVYRKEITKQDTLKVLQEAKNLGYNQICFEINDKLYSNFDPSDFFGKAPTQVVNLENLEFNNAYKVIVCSKNKITQKMVENLPDSCKGIITDNGKLCQIMDSQASKWNCVKGLSKKIGIKLEDIIAFGDDYNDIDLIKNAGTGIAMGNAEQSVKEIADFITDSNMNNGVANYIKENFIEQETER